jgi:hypothetical protein
MTPKVKPGIVSLVVFTAAVALLFWVAVEEPREPFAFLVTAFVWFIWLTAWRRHRKLGRQINELSAQVEAGREELQQRTAKLEAALAELREASAAPPPVAAAAARAAAAAPPSIVIPVPARAEQLSAPPPPPPVPAGQAAAIPTFAQVGDTVGERGPGIFRHLSSRLKLEELLGVKGLALVGALILVLGMAFVLNWAFRSMTPAGRVAVGWLVGAVVLGAGILLQRKEQYRIVARSAVAAGWAIAFFTAFAMNHVAAAHVIDSELVDLGLMFVVAAVMVLHTLRYNSQIATGLAFLCAFAGMFATVFPSREVAPVGVSSLAAALVLAAWVVWVAVRRQWFVLEVCAIVATFLNHFVFLIHIIQPMGKHHHSFPEFFPSAGIAIGYWAVYRASYLIRGGPGHERISALAALLNTGLLMAVLKYQSVHPEYAFWALLVLGSLELGLGQIPQARRRSMPHIVLTVIGASLLFTAIPFRAGLQTEFVSLTWLAEAEAFFLTGVLTQEKVFRRVGLFAFVPLASKLISFEAARVFGARIDGVDVRGMFVPAAICALTALVLYLDVLWAPRRWASQFQAPLEQVATRDLSYAAAMLGLVSGWMAFPLLGTAVSWMALACAMAWLANRFELQPLRIQSVLLAACGFMRVLVVNLPSASSYHLGNRVVPARPITTAAAVVLCYLAAHWLLQKDVSLRRWLDTGLTWAASIMLTLLVWYQLSSVSVALGWGVFALIMLEAGIWRGSANLRLQAYIAALSSFLRLLFVNLNAISPDRFSPRLYTVVPLAAMFFYMYQRLDEQADHLSALEKRFRVGPIFAWLGTTTLVLLLRFETPLDWVATAWAAVACAAMAVAWWTQKRVFMHQALAVSLGVLFRGVLHNLYERSYFTPPSRMLSVLNTVSAAGLLFAALLFAFKLRRQPNLENKNWLARAGRALDGHPEQVLFFVPFVLVTAFLAVEVRSELVTLAWMLEAFAVFVAALWIGERSYRLSALGLVGLVVGKIFGFDFWKMSVPSKAITFVVVGSLITGVAVLSIRYREKVRQYL